MRQLLFVILEIFFEFTLQSSIGIDSLIQIYRSCILKAMCLRAFA